MSEYQEGYDEGYEDGHTAGLLYTNPNEKQMINYLTERGYTVEKPSLEDLKRRAHSTSAYKDYMRAAASVPEKQTIVALRTKELGQQKAILERYRNVYRSTPEYIAWGNHFEGTWD